MHLGPLVCHPSVKDIYNFPVNIVEHIDHSLKRLNLLELDKKILDQKVATLKNLSHSQYQVTW